jgi:hypothetical protein
VDKEALLVQFKDFRKTAVGLQKEHGLSNYDAWVQSVTAVLTSSGQTQLRHPCAELRAVLSRYGAFLGASTSSVERTFALLVDAGKQRSMLSTINATVDLRLRLAPRGTEAANIVHAASKIWAQRFGCHKKSGPTRKRRWQSGTDSSHHQPSSLATQFTAKRRKAAAQLVVDVRRGGNAAASLQRLAANRLPWSAGHTKAQQCTNQRCCRPVCGGHVIRQSEIHTQLPRWRHTWPSWSRRSRPRHSGQGNCCPTRSPLMSVQLLRCWK